MKVTLLVTLSLFYVQNFIYLLCQKVILRFVYFGKIFSRDSSSVVSKIFSISWPDRFVFMNANGFEKLVA